MHIIIPMSGVGQRFINAGYETPKPLIKMDGITMVEHVCNMFPGEDKITFICNSGHLKETNMRSVLESIRPNATIREIPNHKKGPVYAVSLIEDIIEDDEEVIVNYCDFSVYWDYKDFLQHTRSRNADGAVVGYTGFHPHMLGDTAYAHMRGDNQWMEEIIEKQSFTNERMKEYTSNGTYYYKNGGQMKKYFKEMMEADDNINNEYFASLAYNPMMRDGLKVSIYVVQHMLQWGTPQDVHEYNMWSSYFSDIVKQGSPSALYKNTVSLIPLAGKGQRFVDKGYDTPKPLIEVGGKPMIVQAADNLPQTEKFHFVVLKSHTEAFPLENTLKSNYSDCQITAIDKVTEGQAITCSIGVNNIDPDKAIFIGATDNGMVINHEKLRSLIDDDHADAIVFTHKNHVSAITKPFQYGWVDANGDDAIKMSVKIPLSDTPENDHALVGSFYFKSGKLFTEALEQLIAKNIRVNNEFYVDSMIDEVIDLGYKVKVFQVDHFICWGTPDDYETFNYWQSFFHKADFHPFSIEKAIYVNQSKIEELKETIIPFKQKYN